MFAHTGARADQFSAALARTLLVLAAMLAFLGLAALLHLAALPLWAWVFIAPDALMLTVTVSLFLAAPRTPAGG